MLNEEGKQKYLSGPPLLPRAAPKTEPKILTLCQDLSANVKYSFLLHFIVKCSFNQLGGDVATKLVAIKANLGRCEAPRSG